METSQTSDSEMLAMGQSGYCYLMSASVQTLIVSLSQSIL